ncbi:LOW QUALITY PROTEIN: hypothetical protein YC2023_101546 [Brassica napus]
MKIRALTTTKYSVQLFGYYNGEFPNVSCRFERTIASISIATSYPLGSMPGLVNRYQRVERGSDFARIIVYGGRNNQKRQRKLKEEQLPRHRCETSIGDGPCKHLSGETQDCIYIQESFVFTSFGKHLTPQLCLNLSFLSSLFSRKVKTKYYLHTPISSINEIGVAEAINIVTSIAFLIAFAILRIQPVNDIAYFPKWYLKGLGTSSIQTGGFGSKFINLDFMSYV